MFKKAMQIFITAMLLVQLTLVISSKFATNGLPAEDFPTNMPLLYVDPENVTGLNPGDSFTISVKVFNLTATPVTGCKDWSWGHPLEKGDPSLSYILGNIYGIQLEFNWDPDILDYAEHIVTIPKDDYPDGILYNNSDGFIMPIEDIVNQEGGTYSLAYACVDDAPVFNGNGTVFTMTFTVIKKGTCFLHIVYSKMTPLGTTYQLTVPHLVRDGYFGRDVAVAKVETQEKIAEGHPAWINATVSNLGGGTENFTLAAYYNTTADGDWEPLHLQPLPQAPLAENEQNVTNLNGTRFCYVCEPQKFVISDRTLQLWWNTTGVAKGYYSIKINTTGVPDEQNVTDNVQYSKDLVWITEETHDVLIENLTIVAVSKNPKTLKVHEFLPPLVAGEVAKINFTVLNDGSVEETGINVTLYSVDPDGYTEILLTPDTISQMPGDREVFAIENWASTGLKGNYTIGANVTAMPGEIVTDNNQMERSFWIVEPPKVNFTWTGKYLYVNDTVTFNGSLSTTLMPGGSIVHFEWKVYKGDVLPANLKYTAEGPTMTYTFSEWSDKWPVILNVTDNFGLFYVGYDRYSTRPYQFQQNMVMKEKPKEEEAGWPPMWTYAIIAVIIIVIVVVAVYMVKIRKPKSKST